jgi:hypothetical protein
MRGTVWCGNAEVHEPHQHAIMVGNICIAGGTCSGLPIGEETEVQPANKLPRFAIIKGRGKCRVLSMHGKDHFILLTKNDTRVMYHRDLCTFTNR